MRLIAQNVRQQKTLERFLSANGSRDIQIDLVGAEVEQDPPHLKAYLSLPVVDLDSLTLRTYTVSKASRPIVVQNNQIVQHYQLQNGTSFLMRYFAAEIFKYVPKSKKLSFIRPDWMNCSDTHYFLFYGYNISSPKTPDSPFDVIKDPGSVIYRLHRRVTEALFRVKTLFSTPR